MEFSYSAQCGAPNPVACQNKSSNIIIASNPFLPFHPSQSTPTFLISIVMARHRMDRPPAFHLMQSRLPISEFWGKLGVTPTG